MSWSPFRLAQRALDRILGIPSANLTELDPAEEMELEMPPMVITGPDFDGPLDRIPRNRAEVIEMFGVPGRGKADPAWERANIITVRDLPGVPPRWHFQTHRLVEPYIREGLRRAAIAAPEYRIERAASRVFRHIRHDKDAPLSMHSWGIAFDVDPSLNGGKTLSKRAEPWGPEWMTLWPKGLPRAFVEAIESVGFQWGGRWFPYCDPMHMEFTGKSKAKV